MDDKEIKQMLKDASKLLDEAARAWPKQPVITFSRLQGADYRIDKVNDIVYIRYKESMLERPMGGEGGEDA